MHLLPEIREKIEQLQAEKELFTLGHQPVTEFLFIIGFFLVYIVEEVVHKLLAHGNDSCSNDPLHTTMSVRCHQHNNQGAIEHVPFSTTTSASCNHDDTHSVNISIANKQRDIASKEVQIKRQSSARGLLTILALSLHEILEGLSVGLASNRESTWNMSIAIASHKLVIAFCIGFELLTSRFSTKKILSYIFVFSVVTPLGIGIGMILMESEVPMAIPTVLQALAAGTLLYVVFFEILARERACNEYGLLHLAGAIVGFAVMYGIASCCEYLYSFLH